MDMKDSPSRPYTGIETAAVHAGENRDEFRGSLSVPIFRSAVFALPDADQASAIHEGRQPGYFYGRIGNPTQSALEAALCALESGQAALALASGMAAISTALLSIVKPGDHIIAPQSIYATAFQFMDQFLKPFGIAVSYVDAADPGNYLRALRPTTKVLYLESPSNPTLVLTDVAQVVAIARKHGLTTVIDNTIATPINQRPLLAGVDVVVHSATKYLAGHADLMGGVIVASEPFIQAARWQVTKVLGGIVSPDVAWLVLRGLKTLALRMEGHNRNARAVAAFLESHPKVQAVHYPGLPCHPQHELAQRQMQGSGGLLSFELGGFDEARRLVNAVRLCSLSVSFGDVATLIQHSASMTYASMSRERRLTAGVHDGLIRLSVGIESVDDIIADLDSALRAA